MPPSIDEVARLEVRRAGSSSAPSTTPAGTISQTARGAASFATRSAADVGAGRALAGELLHDAGVRVPDHALVAVARSAGGPCSRPSGRGRSSRAACHSFVVVSSSTASSPSRSSTSTLARRRTWRGSSLMRAPTNVATSSRATCVADDARAEADHVDGVVLDALMGGVAVVDRLRADARDLRRRDADAGAGPADQHAALGLPARDRAADGERDVRVVVARAEVEDLVAEVGQDLHDGGVERCSGVIDPDRDDHRRRP